MNKTSKEKKLAAVLDVTPTWSGLVNGLLAVLRDGDAEGQTVAIGEIRRMAEAADKWNAHCKAETDLLTEERRNDMLVGALEGGSNYWYFLDKDAIDILEPYRLVDKAQDAKEPLVDLIMRAVMGGAEIPVRDYEDPKNTLLGTFSLASMRRGEPLMRTNQPKHWADLVGENDDACTADVWFQFCVLGEFIYG